LLDAIDAVESFNQLNIIHSFCALLQRLFRCAESLRHLEKRIRGAKEISKDTTETYRQPPPERRRRD